jgi:hypothetical protein
MNRFDVNVYAIRHRRGRRRPFEVRWQAAGRARSKSFITRALADSYRAELVRAARKGLEFDPQTGEPVLWAEPEPVTVTWYQHAAAYAAMKWPALAAHSQASVAEALATVTPALTRATRARPPAAQLRTALYQHAFNPARTATSDEATAHVLTWAEQASLPLARLARPDSAPSGARCPDLAAGWQPRCREYHHPQTRRVPQRLGLRGPDRATEHQPRRPGQLAGPEGCHRHRSEGRRQPRAGRDLARRRGPDPARSDRVLRLPVLRRAAPGRSHRPAPGRLLSAPAAGEC